MEISLNPLDQLDPVVIVATVLIFLATFAVLRRVFVLPYLAVMEKRESLFEQADARADEVNALTKESESSAERSVADAKESSEELLSKANEDVESYRRERIESATTAASARLEEGRAKIEGLREEALAKLKQEAFECVGLACERLLGEVDKEAVEGAVERLMSGRVH